MKQFTFLLFVLFFSSCFFTGKTVESPKFDIPYELQEFLKEFENAAINHDKDKMLKLTDDDYMKEQHDEMLKGRSDQFLDELFCGYTSKSKTFTCPGFDKVSKLKLLNVENNTDSYTVYYNVTAGSVQFSISWTVTVKETQSGIKYGIYGAVG